MGNNNEYERLVKAGYVEEGTLVIRVDDITKMQLTEEQVKSESAKQGARYDKGVVVVDSQGRMKKISSLMFGYNKNQVQLGNGDFLNADELIEALEAAVNNLSDGTIIVDKKGKFLNPQDLLRVSEEAAGKIKIGDKSNAVTNQDSRRWSVEGANSDIEHKKGVAFLGNDGIDLKKGDYISIDEFLKALNEYVVMTPPSTKQDPGIDQITDPKPQPKENQEQENKIVRVAHKYKNKLSNWLVLLSILSVLLSGMRVKDNIRTIEMPVEYKERIEMMVEQDQLAYSLNAGEYEQMYETIDQARRRIVSGYKLGDEVYLKEGTALYEGSNMNGKKAVIGNKYRKAGNYEISGVSILYDGKIYDAYVETTINNYGFDLGKFINDVCEKNNLDLSRVSLSLHLGNTANNTRTGWIDMSKLIVEEDLELQEVSKKYLPGKDYNGIINNFNGSTITIQTAGGPVTLTIMDENGKLLNPGSIIMGSDGKEYRIDNLDLSQVETLGYDTVTKTAMQKTDVVDGKKLTWNIQDCSLAVGLAPLLTALAASLATKKKNEEAEKNPTLFEFSSEEEYLNFKKEFEEAKEKYENTSGFKKMLKNLFYRKEVDLMQNLTEEQIQQLYSVIRNWNDENYKYSPGDKISFKNGKIVVTLIDGQTKDITDIVTPAIASIGKDNEVVTEGLLETEEEKENGVHR